MEKLALNKCYEELPISMKSIAKMRFKQNKSMKDISKETGRSLGAVSSTLSRIRSKLLTCTRSKINQKMVYGEFINE